MMYEAAAAAAATAATTADGAWMTVITIGRVPRRTVQPWTTL